CRTPYPRITTRAAAFVTNTLHTHNPVKTIPEDALSQAVCLVAGGQNRQPIGLAKEVKVK
ncbi:MAG: hypothetical protein M3Q16_09165, partial [Pseudomonadota bacterium]|nr:hypothetical protein [Pseudomonadota bacterium]